MESKEIKWATALLLEKAITFQSIDEFKDGVLLIELLQIITDKKIIKYFKQPRNRIQAIENVNIALSFMKQNGLLFTQVSPQDLIDGSEKSIISMIYRLYLLVTSKSRGNKKKYRLSLDENSIEELSHSNNVDIEDTNKIQVNTNHNNNSKLMNQIKSSRSEDGIATNNTNNISESSSEDEHTTEDEEEDIKFPSTSPSAANLLIDNNWKKTLNSNFSKLKDKNFLGNNRRMTFSNSIVSNLSDSTKDLLSLSQSTSPLINSPPLISSSSPTSPITSTPPLSTPNSSTPSSMNSQDTLSNSSITSSSSDESLSSHSSPIMLSRSPNSGHTIELSSSLSTTSLNPWFSVKVDANKSKPKNKVPLLVKISPVDLARYDNPDLLPQILKSQQIVKCYISKRKLKIMIKFNNHRNRCFQEIVSTEETYVQVVEKIVKVFYEQLLWNSKYSPTPYITQENIQVIFSTIAQIYSFNQELLKRLKERQKTWDSREKVGDVFVSLSHFLKVYKTYCLNYDNAIVYLQDAKKNEKFNLFIKSILNHPDNIGTQSLESLLINVVQRIPRYILLLQDLVKHTWTDHQDYQNLKTAIKMVTDVATEVNSSIKMAESQAKVLEIQKSLLGFDGELVCPSRHFLKKGTIMECKLDTNIFTKDNDELIYFLFNDSILLTTYNTSQKQHNFKHFFDLTDNQTRIKDVDDSQVIKNGFQFISQHSTLMLSCNSAQEKSTLVQHIQNFQAKAKKPIQSMHLNNNNNHSTGSVGGLGASLESSNDGDIDDFFLTGPHTVKIFKSESKKEPGKKEFTLYHISVTKDSTEEQIIITKRYSDFDHLSKKLKKKFPDQDLKDLPKKHFINSLNTSTVESRRIMLEVYLQHCFQLENIRTSVYIINFIKSLKPQFTSESTFDDFTRSDMTRSDLTRSDTSIL